MVAQRLVTIFWASAFATLAAQDAGQATPAAPSFEKAPCPFTADAEVTDQVRCGYVTVPENRAAPGSRRLRLAVAIMKSRSSTPRPDPIVVIGGGPGGKMVDRVPGYVRNGPMMDALRSDRDVIVYDQRGVGFSEPTFCPEAAAASASGPPEVLEAYRARQRQQLARCGESMRGAGYDLSQYNSAVSAHDLQDLRRALGYERWNLRAASYGTRLAMVALRVAPQGIRSAVLDSPWSPNRAGWFNQPADFVDVLQRLSAACAAQPACNAAFPEVERTFWRTVDDWQRSPKARPVPLPNGASATVMVNGSMVAAAVSTLLRREQQGAVPLAIHAAASGDEAALTALTRVLARGPDASATEPNLGFGLHYTVNCFEEAPLNTAELQQRMRSAHPAALTDGGVFPDPTLCQGLHAFRAGPEHAVLAESEIPALIFTGEFDLQTHRSNGALLARSLKNGQLVEIPSAGHVQSWRHACTRTMMREFYNRPLEKVDAGCLKSIPPLRFVTSFETFAK